ncbi:MAG: nitroreductase family protein [Planctomycetota bacterium]
MAQDNTNMDLTTMTPESVRVLRSVMHARKTEKVLVEHGQGQELTLAKLEQYRAIIAALLIDAGMAPFHYYRGVDSIAEPWRAHAMMQPETRRLAALLRDDLGIRSKEPKLLEGCGAVILITWLPEAELKSDTLDASSQKVRKRDEEHLAATAAMVQNLLLLLTAHGFGNYWSSGGVLGREEAFERLSIPEEERLMAAIFIAFPELNDQPSEKKYGSQRDKRSDQWIRWPITDSFATS